MPGAGGGRGPRGDGAARAARGREDRRHALREKQVRAQRRHAGLGQARRAFGIAPEPVANPKTVPPARRSILSRGGADSTQLKPPRHRVSPSRTRKTSGNSRCQWKNPCSPRSRPISARVPARIPSAPRSRRSSRTRLTIAGGASGVLAQAKAAHQASATRRFARKAAESRHVRYSAAWRPSSAGPRPPDLRQGLRQRLVGVGVALLLAEQGGLSRVRLGIGAAQGAGIAAVVAVGRPERLVGDAALDQLRARTDQGIARPDMASRKGGVIPGTSAATRRRSFARSTASPLTSTP